MKSLYNYSLSELETEMLNLNQKVYRAKQIYSWLYQKRVHDIDEMSDISASFRDVLKSEYSISLPKVIREQVSYDGTIKLLLELEDKSSVETVLMRYDYGNAICVSSQVGCNMGCKFCASGLIKKQRDLQAYEMILQVMKMQEYLDKEGKDERVSHIVIMGSGEPFDNYDNVMRFIRIANDQKGLAIGARHITVSTSGIAPRIIEYSKEGLQVNLAISLHASNDETRNKLMPVNKAYPLAKLFDAIKEYSSNADRRVTIEYILLKGINDSLENADELANLLKGTFAYVNLIPYNEVQENEFKRSDKQAVRAFYERLKNKGINVTIRKEFGSDIDAACGQLRAKKEGVISE
jgi:23S rRNA (adenine2503-C2)-methyltransferase